MVRHQLGIVEVTMGWRTRVAAGALAVLAVSGVGAEQLVAFLVKPGDVPPHALTLHRIDVSYNPQTGYTAGWPVPIGPLGIDITGISLAPSGRLLGVDAANSRLVEINTGTGQATPLVDLDPPPPDFVYDIAVDPTGQGWLVGVDTSGHNALYRLDLATGHTMPVGDTGLTPNIVQSLTWLNGMLYAADGIKLYSIDPTTAQTTLIAEGGGTFYWTWYVGVGSDAQSLWYVDCSVGEPGPPYVEGYGVYDLATGMETLLGGWTAGDGCDPGMIEVLRLGGAGSEIPALSPVGIASLILMLAVVGVLLIRRSGG